MGRNIFEGAPHATARVVDKGSTTDALTDVPCNTVFVEFLDAEGRPSRGSQDYALDSHCSLEIDDEVEVTYAPYGEEFDRLTEPFVKVSTGILKGMLRVVGQREAAEAVDRVLEGREDYEHYLIRIEGFDGFLS